jgi:hypothetical protein
MMLMPAITPHRRLNETNSFDDSDHTRMDLFKNVWIVRVPPNNESGSRTATRLGQNCRARPRDKKPTYSARHHDACFGHIFSRDTLPRPNDLVNERIHLFDFAPSKIFVQKKSHRRRREAVKRAGHSKIPTGFRPKAQGCEARATLGHRPQTSPTPTGLCPCGKYGCNPVGVENHFSRFTQGSSFVATLG